RGGLPGAPGEDRGERRGGPAGEFPQVRVQPRSPGQCAAPQARRAIDGHTQFGGESTMRLKGKKVAVLAEEIYQEMELWVPYYRLKEEGADVKIVAPEKKTYKSKLG